MPPVSTTPSAPRRTQSTLCISTPTARSSTTLTQTFAALSLSAISPLDLVRTTSISLALLAVARAADTTLLLPWTRTVEAEVRKGWLTRTTFSSDFSSLARKVAPLVIMNRRQDSKSSLSRRECSFWVMKRVK